MNFPKTLLLFDIYLKMHANHHYLKLLDIQHYTYLHILMSFLLMFALDYYSDYLDYTYKYKSVYLLTIVGFVGGIYLISCYLTGLLKGKNFKTN